MDIEKLKRRLNRLKGQQYKLQKEHNGNETKYTYWGGYDLGYLKGKICEIENIIDDMEDNWIPLTNELPTVEKNGEKVLIYRLMNEGQTSLAMSIFDTNMIKHCNKEETCWMELPKPPKNK